MPSAKAAMMFCASCGGALADRAAFCSACGRTTGGAATATATVPPPVSGYAAPAGGQWPGPGPVEPGDKPSYWPTILISFFFGIFGLIPAIRHSKMAARRGYQQNGYWVAFGTSFGTNLVLGILVPIVLFVALAASVSHTNQYSASTPTSLAAPADSSATANTGTSTGDYGTPTHHTHDQLVAAARRVEQIVTEYPAFTLPPSVLQSIASDPSGQNPALGEACKILGPNCVQDLIAAKNAPPEDVQFLEQWGQTVVKAAQAGQLPSQ